MTLPLPQPGDLLGGKCTVVRKLGEGGMGVVFEVRHASLGKRFAVKVLRNCGRFWRDSAKTLGRVLEASAAS